MSEGIDAAALAKRFGFKTIVDWKKVDRLVASGHLIRHKQRIAATARGRLLLDHILAEIAATDLPASAAAVPLPVSPEPLAQAAQPALAHSSLP